MRRVCPRCWGIPTHLVDLLAPIDDDCLACKSNVRLPTQGRLPADVIRAARVVSANGREDSGTPWARLHQIRGAIDRNDLSFDSNAVFSQKIKVAAELRTENRIRI